MPLSWVVRSSVAPFSLSAPISACLSATGRYARRAHADDGSGGGPFHRVQPVQHAGAGRVRLRRDSARFTRIVWIDGVFRRAAPARIRHPIGAGRGPSGAAQHGGGPGDEAGHCRYRHRTGRRFRLDAPDGDHAVRRQSHRYSGIRNRCRGAGPGGAAGQLPSRAPRDRH